MKKKKLLIKVSDFIVNFRYLFLCFFIALIIICSLNINNVKINYDITSYLPNDTETKNGLELMQKEFGKLNSMQLMITNIKYEDVLIKVKLEIPQKLIGKNKECRTRHRRNDESGFRIVFRGNQSNRFRGHERQKQSQYAHYHQLHGDKLRDSLVIFLAKFSVKPGSKSLPDCSCKHLQANRQGIGKRINTGFPLSNHRFNHDPVNLRQHHHSQIMWQ